MPPSRTAFSIRTRWVRVSPGPVGEKLFHEGKRLRKEKKYADWDSKPAIHY
jgi:hypothetical protein